MTRPTSTSPAAPPTTPPAIVPAGAVSSSPLFFAGEAVLDALPEVAVAPSPAAPARPTPFGSSEEL